MCVCVCVCACVCVCVSLCFGSLSVLFRIPCLCTVVSGSLSVDECVFYPEFATCGIFFLYIKNT